MFTKLFWRDLSERVLSSIAGGALAALGAGAVDLLAIDVQAVVSVALGAGLVSLLKGLLAGAAPVGNPGTPSLVETAPRSPQV